MTTPDNVEYSPRTALLVQDNQEIMSAKSVQWIARELLNCRSLEDKALKSLLTELLKRIEEFFSLPETSESLAEQYRDLLISLDPSSEIHEMDPLFLLDALTIHFSILPDSYGRKSIMLELSAEPGLIGAIHSGLSKRPEWQEFGRLDRLKRSMTTWRVLMILDFRQYTEFLEEIKKLSEFDREELKYHLTSSERLLETLLLPSTTSSDRKVLYEITAEILELLRLFPGNLVNDQISVSSCLQAKVVSRDIYGIRRMMRYFPRIATPDQVAIAVNQHSLLGRTLWSDQFVDTPGGTLWLITLSLEENFVKLLSVASMTRLLEDLVTHVHLYFTDEPCAGSVFIIPKSFEHPLAFTTFHSKTKGKILMFERLFTVFLKTYMHGFRAVGWSTTSHGVAAKIFMAVRKRILRIMAVGRRYGSKTLPGRDIMAALASAFFKSGFVSDCLEVPSVGGVLSGISKNQALRLEEMILYYPALTPRT